MEAKKVKSFESGSSKSRIDVQDKPKFKKRFLNQVPSNFSKNRNDRGSNPKPQKGKNVNPQKSDQLVVSLVRNMQVNVLLVLLVSILVAKVAIW